MRSVTEMINNKRDLKAINRKNFMLAKEDKNFSALCYKLDLDDEELMKYTSKLEKTVCELSNCKGCKGLNYCKNDVKGHVDFPENKDEGLVFSYIPCRYKKEEEKNKSKTVFYETPLFLRNAKMSEIYVDDEERVELLKYIKKFMKEYPSIKGVYLYGSFGSGKSYILNAVINELSKKGEKCVSIYYPTLLKKLKDSFSNKNTTYEQIFTELEMCDCLLIDDIGAENNTSWSRDEVLGALLQSRMDNNKITFFTSNLDLDELEKHLGETSSKIDKIKARRIIERVKQLSTPISLISENKRDAL